MPRKVNPRPKKKCDRTGCKHYFKPKTDWARFCSAACRQRAFTQRHREQTGERYRGQFADERR